MARLLIQFNLMLISLRSINMKTDVNVWENIVDITTFYLLGEERYTLFLEQNGTILIITYVDCNINMYSLSVNQQILI